MTIYEALGIEELLVDITIPKETIYENLQYSSLSRNAKRYFEVVERVILRATVQRFDFELHIIEVSLNEPKYIQEISAIIQTAIKYRILFVFSFNERFLLLRRSFQLTVSTDHVYSDSISLTTDWIYSENLTDDDFSFYDGIELSNDSDSLFTNGKNLWIDEDDASFRQIFEDIFNQINNLNASVIENPLLCLRQFCDWFVGHSITNRINLRDLFECINSKDGFFVSKEAIFLDKNAIRYAIATLENSKYLRSISNLSRHPFTYFQDLKLLNYSEVERIVIEIINTKNSFSVEDGLDVQNIIDDSLQSFYKAISKYPLLKREDEALLFERMQCGDLDARNTLIVSNLRYVVSIAKHYVGHGLELDDLIQEGTLGLIRALENHDLRYETRITTYAKYWIQQHIQRALEDQGNLIRLPVYMHERLYQIKKAKDKFVQTLGFEPTDEDIAQEIGISSILVTEAKTFGGEVVSLDSDDENECHEDSEFFADTESPTCYEWLRAKELRNTLEQVLQTLTPREEHVIKLRFGIYDGRLRSLEEVGKQFNITRERIRQIEAKALRKLRHPSRARHLRGFRDDEDTKVGMPAGMPFETSYPTAPFSCGESFNKPAQCFSKQTGDYVSVFPTISHNASFAKDYTVEKTCIAEEARLAEEMCKSEEARLAEERRKAEEEARLAEEQCKAEEHQRYLDAKQKAEEEYRKKQAIERERAERAKAEEARIAEEARKQELYSQCKQTFDSCNDILFLTNAIVKLETIIDWQNSRQLINKIQNKIGRLQIEEEKAKRRSQKVCPHCGGKFKGLFNKRCSVCGMPKDY